MVWEAAPSSRHGSERRRHDMLAAAAKYRSTQGSKCLRLALQPIRLASAVATR